MAVVTAQMYFLLFALFTLFFLEESVGCDLKAACSSSVLRLHVIARLLKVISSRAPLNSHFFSAYVIR